MFCFVLVETIWNTESVIKEADEKLLKLEEISGLLSISKIKPKFGFLWKEKRCSVWSGPNLDLLCIWQSNAAQFCEIYAKLLFDAKALENLI